MEVKYTDVKVFKSFVYWANSRITEEESNVKNKENGTDGALFTFQKHSCSSVQNLFITSAV